MAALLPEGDEPAIVEADQQTRVVVAVIVELDHITVVYFRIRRNSFLRHRPTVAQKAHHSDPALPGDDHPCLLIRLDDGRLVAFGQECSHLSCAVIPEPERGQLRCPCHNGYFEIREGRPIAGPPRRPLPRVMLAVRDGAIYATGVELRTV